MWIYASISDLIIGIDSCYTIIVEFVSVRMATYIYKSVVIRLIGAPFPFGHMCENYRVFTRKDFRQFFIKGLNFFAL